MTIAFFYVTVHIIEIINLYVIANSVTIDIEVNDICNNDENEKKKESIKEKKVSNYKPVVVPHTS